MMPNRKDHEVGDVVTGPWTNTPAEPVEPVEGELVEREPVEAPTRRLESPGEAGTGATGPVAAVRPGRPLTVEQAGGRYQYVTSLAAAGARRIPSSLLDGVLNRVKLAHLREGGTHRGEILPAQRNVYETEMRERRDRRRKFGVALFVRKTRTTSHSLSGKHVRDAHRPRWETVAPLGAEVANLTWPHTPILSPLVNGVNGVVAEASTAVVGAVGDGISAAAMSTPGAAAMALGAAGLVAWQARNEHHDRQSQLIALMSADGNGDLMPDVEADYLTAAFRAAGILKAATANAPGEHVELLTPVSTNNGAWSTHLRLPKGMPYTKAAKRRIELASALDTDVKRVSLAPVAGAERELVLTVYQVLPFTGAPVAHPLISGNKRISFAGEGFPVGVDIDGNTVSIRLSRDSSPHGLIVAASGMGKTVHLRNLILSALASGDAEIGGVYDGKASGDYEVLLGGIGWYVDKEKSPAWWSDLADLLEQEVEDLPERQRRIKAGEHVPMRLIILDEFQNGFGKTSDRTSSKKEDELPSPAYRVVAATEELSRLGRSAGVALVLASQSFDGNVLPSSIENNLMWRLVGYVPSPSVAPKDSVGEAASLYNLVPQEQLTKKQKGAVIVLAPEIDQYTIARGWYQDDDVIADAVSSLVTTPAAQSGPVLHAVADDQADAAAGEVIELGEVEQQILAAAAEVYSGDDAEWVKASELYAEVIEGELDWTVDRAMQMKVSAAMKDAGVEKRTESKTLPSGKKTNFVSYRRADIVATGQRLGRAA